MKARHPEDGAGKRGGGKGKGMGGNRGKGVRAKGNGRGGVGDQCILCGRYYKSYGVLRHYKLKHPSYLGGVFRHHPKYPAKFNFKPLVRKNKCPKIIRPRPDTIVGVESVNHRFLGTDSDSD